MSCKRLTSQLSACNRVFIGLPPVLPHWVLKHHKLLRRHLRPRVLSPPASISTGVPKAATTVGAVFDRRQAAARQAHLCARTIGYLAPQLTPASAKGFDAQIRDLGAQGVARVTNPFGLLRAIRVIIFRQR